MSDIVFDTKAYAKLILHAAKYPHCAVNGLLLADASQIRTNQNRAEELQIRDAVPLFHHSIHVTPLSEIALTQVEHAAKAAGLMVVGYYAACENFKENTIEKCPGVKIAEKIAEYFTSAIFIVINNTKLIPQLDSPAIKITQNCEGKWKARDTNIVLFNNADILNTVSHLIQRGVQKDLVDFDNHMDNLSLDWGNNALNNLLKTIEKLDN